ncbi:carboxypeptidase-like regulatory domain-containing protein [Gaoshiqia sp. Z1-71]|uniref:carboxypeptidase-like regulatory domain-containing protein n=1 Tax=Gaoshiqia hydrogeniformans TaxID=3290090 RepID=UPI003BF896FA
MRNRFQITGIILLTCISFRLGAQQNEAFAQEQKISLNIYERTVAEALDEISRLSGLSFSYDPLLVNADDIVSFSCEDQEIHEILNDLLGDGYEFRQLKDQLIITLKSPPSARLKDFPAEPSPDMMIISGLVTEAGTKETIPYVSISVLNEPFGTITNRDGQYELKVPEKYRNSAIVFSCMGYGQQSVQLDTLNERTVNIALRPIDIRLAEIEVRAIDPVRILDKMMEHIPDNYPDEIRLMTSFYREVLLQDKKYINASEAIINILKSPYDQTFREDRIRYLKGRRSPDVEPFKWVDFKMQGGPYYITKLDVVKTMDSFIDPEYRSFYRYEMDYLIDYLDRPTYVVLFEPSGKIDFPCYQGKLFIDQQSFALVHAEFSLGKSGMKYARKSLIRKKPKGFNVRPLDLNYTVTYKENEGRWNLNTAQTSVRFRVRSSKDHINSVFHSISDLLVTGHEKTTLRRFHKDETFLPTDIFTEMIIDYDKEFWGNFNIIQPDEDLRRALKKINLNETTRDGNSFPDHQLTQQNN